MGDQVTDLADGLVSVLSMAMGGLERAKELLELGGPVAVILLGMSMMALTIVLAKLWQFSALRVGSFRPAREALRLYRKGRPMEALVLAARSANPSAAVLARAMRGQRRGLPEAALREDILCFGEDMLESLRTGFRPLELIASLAPLLGLLGTVLGMIEAFREMEGAGNQVNPAVLSGGIWEALLTTALGLSVAIPVVAAHGWLERRVERLAHEMGSQITRFFAIDLLEEAEEEGGLADPRACADAATVGR